MKVVKRIKEARGIIKRAKKKGNVIGFVPMMGAIHPGHLSLIHRAKNRCGYVVISIFVNPTQFGPGGDYRRYPRNLAEDIKLARQAGVELIFAPEVSEMYPEEQLSRVEVKKISEGLCGRFRPGHFQGAATVVAKLFNIIQPDIAFFGEKDAQQVLIVKKMVKDLNMPLKIETVPIVRETDGLAFSSRNAYLNKEERKAAVVLYKSLKTAKVLIGNGEQKADKVVKRIKQLINKEPLAKIDYIEIVDRKSLRPVKTINSKALIILAVWIGRARLIDNMKVSEVSPRTLDSGGYRRCKG